MNFYSYENQSMIYVTCIETMKLLVYFDIYMVQSINDMTKMSNPNVSLKIAYDYRKNLNIT